MNSLMLTDGYKTSHNLQYPEGTTLVFSNFTPRSDKYAPTACQDKGIVVFGVQMVLKQIHDHFDKNFFKREERKEWDVLAPSEFQNVLHKGELNKLKVKVINEIKSELDLYLNTDYDVTHFEELWDLGYLPIEVRSLEEGTVCPIRVPMLTIHNTLPEFFWITNYLETIISNLLWKPITSASISKAYKEILVNWATKTDKENVEFVDWQGHDFSMRGMDSVDATIASGLGHLTSFLGTDSLPAIWGARNYYNAEGFVAGSVPATEHSVMCAGSKEDELGTFRRLLQTYPTGILSVVSDTWDLWNVITGILPQLKEEILARDGKLVIRPDSGDPVDILCGTTVAKGNSVEQVEAIAKGVVELLWDLFGGTVNEQGYKVLNSHIGAIYGDSITTDRANEICQRLEAKGFASTNVVLGIGSFTYQYNTRDTFGFAMKATYIERMEVRAEGVVPMWDKVGYEIFKDPITDSGLKKSAKGLLKVINQDGKLQLIDQITWDEFNENDNHLRLRYKNGNFHSMTTLEKVRENLKK
jgi:nicotinamide phosphoribosyltransferase